MGVVTTPLIEIAFKTYLSTLSVILREWPIRNELFTCVK